MMPICPYDQSPLRAKVYHDDSGQYAGTEIYCTESPAHEWNEDGILLFEHRTDDGLPEKPMTVATVDDVRRPLVCPYDGTAIRIDHWSMDHGDSSEAEVQCPNGHRWDTAGQPDPDELPDEPPLFSRVLTIDHEVYSRMNSSRIGWYRETLAPRNGKLGDYAPHAWNWAELNESGPVKLLPPI